MVVIEQGIYFALGAIVTALCALMFAPLFWSRALRLSRRRLQLQIPVSMQEIYAERDGLRAEFAVERLRVEQAAEQVRLSKAADMIEIGRRTVEASRLAEELAAARAELAALREVHDAVQRDAVAATTEAAALRRDLGAERTQGSAIRAELVARHAEVVAIRAEAAAEHAEAASARAEAMEARTAATAAQERHETELTELRDGQAGAVPLSDAGRLQALEDELAAAREREKSLHLQHGLKAEKDRSAERSALERCQQLEKENATLQETLAEARRAAGEAAGEGDASLRESIHALGLAVAAMSREGIAPHAEAAGERDAVG